jgi:hypothetical protein
MVSRMSPDLARTDEMGMSAPTSALGGKPEETFGARRLMRSALRATPNAGNARLRAPRHFNDLCSRQMCERDPSDVPLPTITRSMISPRSKSPHRIAVRIYPRSSIERLLDH